MDKKIEDRKKKIGSIKVLRNASFPEDEKLSSVGFKNESDRMLITIDGADVGALFKAVEDPPYNYISHWERRVGVGPELGEDLLDPGGFLRICPDAIGLIPFAGSNIEGFVVFDRDGTVWGRLWRRDRKESYLCDFSGLKGRLEDGFSPMVASVLRSIDAKYKRVMEGLPSVRSSRESVR
ncbi:hypothetical protein ACFQY0_20680 [Haloferula chungangensis]|uniref:GATA-type domain-containing protein n=1 Tax=Haloferula chungangensis TaxID=1048331 RepID=A0ABW2LAX8_9BACT